MLKYAQVLKAAFEDELVRDAVDTEKLDYAKILAAVIRNYKAMQPEWLPADKGKTRDLYIRAAKRYVDNDRDPNKAEVYLDVRDKADPSWKYSDAVDHSIVYRPHNETVAFMG